MEPSCLICNDEKWVCEDHQKSPWDDHCGGAGIPCVCSEKYLGRISTSLGASKFLEGLTEISNLTTDNPTLASSPSLGKSVRGFDI